MTMKFGRLCSVMYREPKIAAPASNVTFYSQFGGLWTDQLNATDLLQRKISQRSVTMELASQIEFFIQNGYVILKQAVSPAEIDSYLLQFRNATRGGSALLASVPIAGPQDKGIVALEHADINLPLTKVLDTYQHLSSAHPLIFAEKIRTFLREVFEDSIVAFQGLHFEKGSTQAIHQDTAYVVLNEPPGKQTFGSRTTATTSADSAFNRRNIALPTKPVAPVSKILISPTL